MDKKDNIDTLMKEYLGFYQQDSKKINLNQQTDFDDLMTQYKSKFDKQIANEQKIIRERENTRVLQKKQETELQLQRKKEQELEDKKRKEALRNKKDQRLQQTSSSRPKYQPRKEKNTAGYGKWIIIALLVLIGGSLLFSNTPGNDSDFFDSDSYEEPIFYQLSGDELAPVDASELYMATNREAYTDDLTTLEQLKYTSLKDYNEQFQMYIDSDDFLVIENHSDYYLYIKYRISTHASESVLVQPNDTYYKVVSDDKDLIIFNAGFYQPQN